MNLFARIKFAVLGGIAVFLAVALSVQGAPGDLDLSFGGTGKVIANFGFGYDNLKCVAVQADGKLVMAGDNSHYYDLNDLLGVELVRFDTNNVLDPTFGTFGKVSPNALKYPRIFAMQIQTDGRILVAGDAQDGTNFGFGFFALERFNSDGSLDASFGTNGVVTTKFTDSSLIRGMALQPDGRIVVVGNLGHFDTPYSATDYFALARYTTNGMLDTSFNGNGILIEPGDGNYYASSLALQTDGKILVAGADNQSFALFRYATNGARDLTFADGTGMITTAIADESYASALVIQPGDGTISEPDKILVGGTASSDFDSGRFALARYNLDGSPDQSFGTNGMVITSAFGDGDASEEDGFSALLVTGTGEDRQITAAGDWFLESTGIPQFMAVARYDTSGNLNTNFNGTGQLSISFGPKRQDYATAITTQNGKVVIAGTTTVNDEDSDFAAVRLNDDGSLDDGFNGNGIVTADIASSDDYNYARAVALQADGKIVAAGQAWNGVKLLLALARYNTDGSLDETFGVNGRTTASAGGNTISTGVVIQPDGRIVVSGVNNYSATNSQFAAFRFLPNGMLDDSFGTNGIVVTFFNSMGDGASGIALQADGKIVLAGSAYFGDYGLIAVARYTTNGSLDATFNGTGEVTTSITAATNGQDIGQAVQIQTDGKILVAGYGFGNVIDLELVRYNPDGSLDASFGIQGVAIATPTNNAFLGTALALLPDGRLTVTGQTLNSPTGFGMARFLTNGAPDLSFAGSGATNISFNTPRGGYGLAITIQNDGKIVAAGTSDDGVAEQFTTLRFNQDGTLDQTFGVGGIAVHGFDELGGDAIAYGLALDASGRIVLAGDAGLNRFGVMRLQGGTALKILSITRLANGHIFLTGVGLPNAIHTVQATPVLPGNSFTALGTTTADASGNWQFEDASAGQTGSRFYRLSYP